MTKKYFDLIKSPLKGTNLIEASAGTGKTYVIAGLFLRLILEKALPVDKILAVTYTEAATEELCYRIRERLKAAFNAIRRADGSIDNNGNDELLIWAVNKYKGNEAAELRLKDALTRFDEASICTIHGFCRRMLTENAFESNTFFNAELITDQSDLTREIADDFWRMNFYRASSLFIWYAVNKGISPSYFLKLLNNFSIDPHFKIIPQLKKPDLPGIELQFCDAFGELGKKWQIFKPEIEIMLLTGESLNRTKYNPKYIPKWIIDMDDYFSSGNPVAVPDKFEKFTNSSVSASVKNGFDVPEHEFFNACEDFHGIYDRLISYYNNYIIFLESELFTFVNLEAAKRKRDLNIFAFDDLLLNMRNSLAAGEESSLAKTVRSRYNAALIDEFQDTDPVQYDIFRIIFGRDSHVLFLIGDPKQSIYKFRGADIFAYLKASADIHSRYTLRTNWRSGPKLIKAVNTIFNNKKDPFVLKEIEFHEVVHAEKKDRNELIIDGKIADPFYIWTIDNTCADMRDDIVSKRRAEAVISKAVAGEIFNLISLGRDGMAGIGSEALRPGHIAVLVRKRHQARTMRQELAEFNIPGVLYGSESVFASHEAIEMMRLISAIADPGDTAGLKAAFVSDMIGLSGNDIFMLSENETELERYLNRFFEYRDQWLNCGFFYMFRSFADKEGIGERLLSFSDGERRMTNVMHLAELLHRAEIEAKLGTDGLVKWLEEKLALQSESEEHEIRLETDDDAVKLITIHRSKGLEFPVVFCPFMWDGLTAQSGKPFTFHNPGDNFDLTLDIGSRENENLTAAEREELAENMRLLYVALTRAKNRSYLSWGRINESETSAISYIFHHKENGPGDIENLRNSVKFMSYEAMVKDISDIVNKSEGSIKTVNLPDFNYKRFVRDSIEGDEFACKVFTSNIRKDWRISSFSALIHERAVNSEQPDHDWIDNAQRSGEKTKTKDNNYNIYNFPRGASPGTCIHEIFENLDFTDLKKNITEELINSVLTKYEIGMEWQDAVLNMIENVIKTPLISENPDFTLCNVPAGDRLNELEFYFPLNAITSKGLSDVFRKSGIALNRHFSASLEQLDFAPHRGLVKGFIDMVFQYSGRYYIIDWKSNYLGDNIRDYNHDRLLDVMEDNYYILQYYIYTAALHRFLSTRKPGYDYNKDFGGIFYMFVRGVDKDSGIYHDIPAKSAIDSLGNYLAGYVSQVGE